MKPKPPFNPKFCTVPTLILSSSSWSLEEEEEDEEAATDESRRAARIVVHSKAGPGNDAAVDTETTDADVVAWLKSEDPPSLAVDERKRFMRCGRVSDWDIYVNKYLAYEKESRNNNDDDEASPSSHSFSSPRRQQYYY